MTVNFDGLKTYDHSFSHLQFTKCPVIVVLYMKHDMQPYLTRLSGLKPEMSTVNALYKIVHLFNETK